MNPLTKRIYLEAGIVLCLLAMTASAQTRDIRKIDFTNFIYQPAYCSRMFAKDGMPRSVAVKGGEFKTEQVYLDVSKDDLLYGDLTGDGVEKAIVPVTCGNIGANDYLTEVMVFGWIGAKPSLLGTLDNGRLERDYARYHPKTILWPLLKVAAVEDRTLVIKGAADGPHCCPRYDVAFRYRWNGRGFVLIGRPARTLRPQT